MSSYINVYFVYFISACIDCYVDYFVYFISACIDCYVDYFVYFISACIDCYVDYFVTLFQLVLTVMLTSVIVYIYTVVAFNFFRKFYVKEDDGNVDYKCHDMLTVSVDLVNAYSSF